MVLIVRMIMTRKFDTYSGGKMGESKSKIEPTIVKAQQAPKLKRIEVEIKKEHLIKSDSTGKPPSSEKEK